MSEKIDVSIWIAMDENGEYAIGSGRQDAVEAYESCVSSSIAGVRVVHIIASMTPPDPIEIDVDVPDEAGTVIKTEVQEHAEERR